MPTYATQADFEAYVEGWVTTDVAALNRLLERAEADIDRIFASVPREANGRRFGSPKTTNEKGLTAEEVADLTRMTCAQAEYRQLMGEEFFTKAQYDSVAGPELTTRGTLPRVGPKVYDELFGSSLTDYANSYGSVSTSAHAEEDWDVLAN